MKLSNSRLNFESNTNFIINTKLPIEKYLQRYLFTESKILHFKKLVYNLFLEPQNLEVMEFNHGRSEMDCILPKVKNKMTAVEKEGLDNFNRDCNQHGIIFWPKGEEFVDLCARLSNEYGTPIEKVSIILAVRFKSRLNMIC